MLKITVAWPYTLRINDAEGKPLALPIENANLAAGTRWIAVGNVPPGPYYLPRIKDQRPVHYQAYRPQLVICLTGLACIRRPANNLW
jgi:hypothetical protein